MLWARGYGFGLWGLGWRSSGLALDSFALGVLLLEFGISMRGVDSASVILSRRAKDANLNVVHLSVQDRRLPARGS